MLFAITLSSIWSAGGPVAACGLVGYVLHDHTKKLDSLDKKLDSINEFLRKKP